jgi:hypothetical protein
VGGGVNELGKLRSEAKRNGVILTFWFLPGEASVFYTALSFGFFPAEKRERNRTIVVKNRGFILGLGVTKTASD